MESESRALSRGSLTVPLPIGGREVASVGVDPVRGLQLELDGEVGLRLIINNDYLTN